MKDEHDKSTIDFVQASQGMRATSGTDVPHPAKARDDFATDVKRAEAGLKAEQAIYIASQRARQHMESWLPVSHVAKDLCVSTRRVRVLLDAGRIAGRRLENGYWEVLYPYEIRAGRRGPLPFDAKRKKQELLKERTK